METILNLIKRAIPSKIFKTMQPVYHFTMSFIASFLYAHPSEKLVVIGVTGTTGKTTSVYIMAKMLAGLGFKVGYTSTAMFSDGDQEWLNDKKMTMIGRFFTQSILKKMVKNNCQFAIVETTSEGIRQFRHSFINYDWLVFTGLYPEHIESHGSFENYKKSKGKLFKHLKKCRTKYIDQNFKIIKMKSGFKKISLNRVKKTVIANLDDKHAAYFLSFWAEEKLGYTAQVDFDSHIPELPDDLKVFHYGEIETSQQGLSFKIARKRINLNLYGKFNAANVMNSLLIADLLQADLASTVQALQIIAGVPGRMEKIAAGQDFTVIVDYAFEPNALTKLYETIADIPHQKIIHVLGATGGGRDKDKRPRLGKIAGINADYVIVTNEDPYDEDPLEIIQQVAAGAKKSGKQENDNLLVVPDRGLAIRKAINLAGPKDLVLISGKGCEQAICVELGKKISWDDRVVAREALSAVEDLSAVEEDKTLGA